MSDLVTLARKFVDLSDQLEAVRAEIAKAVLNGGGGATPKAPFVKAGRPGRTGSQSQHPNAILAQQAESQIIELIKTTPGLKTTEIAKETGSKVNTTTQRLARMRERGLITRGDGGSGWAAAAPA